MLLFVIFLCLIPVWRNANSLYMGGLNRKMKPQSVFNSLQQMCKPCRNQVVLKNNNLFLIDLWREIRWFLHVKQLLRKELKTDSSICWSPDMITICSSWNRYMHTNLAWIKKKLNWKVIVVYMMDISICDNTNTLNRIGMHRLFYVFQ